MVLIYLFLFPVLTVTSALAGGLTLYEIATPEVGLASSGQAARAQDAVTAVTNPAGMTRLHDSSLNGGLQLLYGKAKFQRDSRSGTQTGGNGGNAIGWAPAASFFVVQAPSDKLRFGFAGYSNFGLALDYDDDWVGRYFVQGVTLIGATLMPSVAYRVNDKLSIGAGINMMYGIFKDQVAIRQPLAGRDGQLKIDTSDWGYGVQFGLLYAVSKGTRVGLTYSSKIHLDFNDKPDFSGLSTGMSALLQAAGLLHSRLSLGMSVPEGVMASVYYEVDSRVAWMADIGWQNWSNFGKVGVELDSTTAPKKLTVDRNYEDTWHAALGVQYLLDPVWTLSGGIAYDGSMVNDKYRTADLPVGSGWRFGVGGLYRWKENLDLNLGYELIWEGNLPLDQNKPMTRTRLAGDYKGVVIHFVTANLRWKF